MVSIALGIVGKKQAFGRVLLRCFATKTVLNSSLLPFPMHLVLHARWQITVMEPGHSSSFVDDVVPFAMLRASCAEHAST
jgi:hypothetical protein